MKKLHTFYITLKTKTKNFFNYVYKILYLLNKSKYFIFLG